MRALLRTRLRAAVEAVFLLTGAPWRVDVLAVAVVAPWDLVSRAVARGADAQVSLAAVAATPRASGPHHAAKEALRRCGISPVQAGWRDSWGRWLPEPLRQLRAVRQGHWRKCWQRLVVRRRDFRGLSLPDVVVVGRAAKAVAPVDRAAALRAVLVGCGVRRRLPGGGPESALARGAAETPRTMSTDSGGARRRPTSVPDGDSRARRLPDSLGCGASCRSMAGWRRRRLPPAVRPVPVPLAQRGSSILMAARCSPFGRLLGGTGCGGLPFLGRVLVRRLRAGRRSWLLCLRLQMGALPWVAGLRAGFGLLPGVRPRRIWMGLTVIFGACSLQCCLGFGGCGRIRSHRRRVRARYGAIGKAMLRRMPRRMPTLGAGPWPRRWLRLASGRLPACAGHTTASRTSKFRRCVLRRPWGSGALGSMLGERCFAPRALRPQQR